MRFSALRLLVCSAEYCDAASTVVVKASTNGKNNMKISIAHRAKHLTAATRLLRDEFSFSIFVSFLEIVDMCFLFDSSKCRKTEKSLLSSRRKETLHNSQHFSSSSCRVVDTRHKFC